MGSPLFIARRYLFSKKTHNVINIISAVSVAGIMISTAALVIVLSGFNGMEDLVISLRSTFEPDVKIESVQSKTFDRSLIADKVYDVEGLSNYTEVIEEVVIIRHEDQFVVGILKGVEDSFLEMSEMEDHLEDGPPVLHDQYGPLGLVSVGVLQKLGGYIDDSNTFLETFTFYVPQKGREVKWNDPTALETVQVPIIGTFFYSNKEVDENYLLLPIDFLADTADYGNQITQIEMKFDEGADLERKKEELQNILGNDFLITTSLDRNKVIYQTSKSEKWMTTLLLGFIFFLATFNMIASVTMLVLEKRADMKTLRAMGAKAAQIRKVFFLEGLLINGLGLILGLTVGYIICYLQQTFGLVRLEGSSVEYFPVAFKLSDLFLILGITLGFGTLAAYLPSRFLLKRIVND